MSAIRICPLCLGLVGALVLLSPVSQATIYKWVDEQGRVSFSDQPQSENAKPIDIRVHQPHRSKAADSKNNQSRQPGKPPSQQGGQLPDSEAQQQAPRLSRKEKRRRCADARKRLQAITVRNRVRERDASGNLRFLTEKERQQRLKQAKTNIRKYCR